MNKNNKISAGIGGSLIIVIFVALCLTVFSVLSFTTAYSDLKLSKKSESMAKDYYYVNGETEQKLSEIYELLINTNDNLISIGIATKENFNHAVINELEKINGLSIVDKNNEFITIYYEVFGKENQKICVTLNILYDDTINIPYYKIKSWNLANINALNYEEENYDLWEGIFE
ncbi:MAG: hypothetical protein K0Q97_1908 [Bacillota bacterium]|jgi:hypothetical protein|nr:hypothetical protein [Bacillota bacterium]